MFDLAADFLRLINPSSQIADPAAASAPKSPPDALWLGPSLMHLL
jgi:hypothetical protein